MCVKKGFDLILEDFLDTIKNGHGSRGHFVLFWFLVELNLPWTLLPTTIPVSTRKLAPVFAKLLLMSIPVKKEHTFILL